MTTPTQLEGPTLSFPCIEVRQPIGTFYVGSIPANDLVAICYADIRSIRQGTPRDVEEFSGIQRPLSTKREDELKAYVHTVDAAFPTSIILHVQPEDAEFTSKGAMVLKRAAKVARILDGQHRIAGLEGYSGPPFELNVAILVGLDPEEQALMFATINLKQTKVNKSLAYDLFDFAKTRSPQRTAHSIARLLNAREGSPFFQRIKVLGVATPGRDETLTQAAFVDHTLPLISDNPMRDRDALKRGDSLPSTAATKKSPLTFRPLFAAEKDAEIAKIVWNYFSSVENRWPTAWKGATSGLILNRTTGFSALMRLLPLIYRRVTSTPDGIPSAEEFAAVFGRSSLLDTDFNRDRFLPGTSGQAALFRELGTQIGVVTGED